MAPSSKPLDCDQCAYPPPAWCWTPECPVYSSPGFQAAHQEYIEFQEDLQTWRESDPRRASVEL